MKRFFKRLHAREAGFTLIELLVVIAIIGILAAIIVPNVSKYIGSGQTAANQAERATVQNAIYAAMATAKVGAVGSGGTVSASSDPTFGTTTTAKVSDYFPTGTVLVGTYTFNGTGSITGATYP